MVVICVAARGQDVGYLLGRGMSVCVCVCVCVCLNHETTQTAIMIRIFIYLHSPFAEHTCKLLDFVLHSWELWQETEPNQWGGSGADTAVNSLRSDCVP